MSWFKRRTEHLEDEDLSAYIDAEQGGRTASFEEHIAKCEACAMRLAELREVKAALSALPRPFASRRFALGPEHALSRPRAERRAAFAFAPAVALSRFVALLAVDLTVVSDGGFRDGIARDESTAGTLANTLEDRALQPATMAQEGEAESGAGAQDGDATAGAATQPDAPPTAPTALAESYAEQTDVAPLADADGAAGPASEASESGARNVIRALEALAAIGFVVTLAVFLRQRRI